MPDTLPAADWTRREDLAALVRALGEGNARWVGGAVRDTLLGDKVHDIDCATPLLPDAVMRRCKAAGIRTVPTGIDHGTVTALLDGGPVEITTLRRDVSTDGRRATVAFADDWREDAARRDFTINALYADPVTLELFDFFGGLDDLDARRVRFIGDARDRIREDHLRILRYYRFQARFGSELDDEAEEACAELAHTIKGLSRERVAMELLKLLGLPDPADTVARMASDGVLAVVLPEAVEDAAARLAALVAQERTEEIVPHPLRRLAALLPADHDVAGSVASRLRFSRDQRKRLGCIARRAASDAEGPRALAYGVGIECAQDRLLLLGQGVGALKDWDVPQFPLKGGALVQRGVAAGPEVARLLQAIERRWVAEGFPNQARVDAIMAEELAA